MRDSFICYKTFYDCIKELPKKSGYSLYNAVFEYVFNGREPELKGIELGIFSMIKVQIDANNLRYSNGKKGGRPKKSKTIGYENQKPLVSKNRYNIETDGYKNMEEINNQTKTEGYFETQEVIGEIKLQKKPNENVNENVNVNENDKKTYMCGFERVWNAYPRKKEKAKAYKCYMARLADGFSEDELETAVKRYADECKKNHTEERYIKLGATFLGPNAPFVDYLGGMKDEPERKIGKLTFSEELRQAAESYNGDFDGFE